MGKHVMVVAMGFDDWPGGGDIFNVKNDPLAWQIILNSDVPIVVGSNTVTRRGLRLTRAEAGTLMRSHGPVGEYLYSLFDDWLKRMPASCRHPGAQARGLARQGVASLRVGMPRAQVIGALGQPLFAGPVEEKDILTYP